MTSVRVKRTRLRDQFDNLVGQADIAPLLNGTFGLEGVKEVAPKTPGKWWERTKEGGYIAIPMPEPAAYIGPSRRPVWRGSDIARWYAEWKDLQLPKWTRLEGS